MVFTTSSSVAPSLELRREVGDGLAQLAVEAAARRACPSPMPDLAGHDEPVAGPTIGVYGPTGVRSCAPVSSAPSCAPCRPVRRAALRDPGRRRHRGEHGVAAAAPAGRSLGIDLDVDRRDVDGAEDAEARMVRSWTAPAVVDGEALAR